MYIIHTSIKIHPQQLTEPCIVKYLLIQILRRVYVNIILYNEMTITRLNG